MIKFFRRIRQKLVNDGALNKYLIYAVGEVFLVMIGILLAVQVNNWNQNRAQNKLESNLLSEMQGNLNQDLRDIRSNIEMNERLLKSNQLVLQQLDLQVPYNDSMQYHYSNLWGYTIFVKNMSAFDNLKSLGFSIISNDTLRIQITNLYSARYEYLINLEKGESQVQLEIFGPLLRKHIRTDALWEKAYPFDPKALVNNLEFKEMIRSNVSARQLIINIYRELEQDVLQLIDAIEAP